VSEPTATARSASRALPDVWHWTVHDERIDFRSDAWAVEDPGGALLIDPLPLDPTALEELGPVQAILLTAACHQRAAWSLRGRLSVPVWAPEDAQGLEEPPDRTFVDGDLLPGRIRARAMHGPTNPHYVFFHAGRAGLTAFCGDLLMTDGGEGYVAIPDEHQEDPARTREAIEELAGIDPETLCPAHGPCGQGHPLRKADKRPR
jgi:glyoxylase-like metal-dependent hydrolase (beta-lactamase superfamily II)